VHLREKVRKGNKKVADRSAEGIHLGISPDSKGWVISIPGANPSKPDIRPKVETSSVVFNEEYKDLMMPKGAIVPEGIETSQRRADRFAVAPAGKPIAPADSNLKMPEKYFHADGILRDNHGSRVIPIHHNPFAALDMDEDDINYSPVIPSAAPAPALPVAGATGSNGPPSGHTTAAPTSPQASGSEAPPAQTSAQLTPSRPAVTSSSSQQTPYSGRSRQPPQQYDPYATNNGAGQTERSSASRAMVKTVTFGDHPASTCAFSHEAETIMSQAHFASEEGRTVNGSAAYEADLARVQTHFCGFGHFPEHASTDRAVPGP
jgi:hypothetical protein